MKYKELLLFLQYDKEIVFSDKIEKHPAQVTNILMDSLLLLKGIGEGSSPAEPTPAKAFS